MTPKLLDFAPNTIESKDQTGAGDSIQISAYDGRINHLNAPPQIAGFFDAEKNWTLKRVKYFGNRVSDLALRAPAEAIGWIFGDNGPIAKFEKD